MLTMSQINDIRDLSQTKRDTQFQKFHLLLVWIAKQFVNTSIKTTSHLSHL